MDYLIRVDELEEKFSEGFVEEFKHNAEFYALFQSMLRGMTPYQAIEHLVKSNQTVKDTLEKVVSTLPPKPILIQDETVKEEPIEKYCSCGKEKFNYNWNKCSDCITGDLES